MKTYPSIPRSLRGRKAVRRLHLFDKLDGSNMRFEWSRKDGWTRFGTRHRITNESHPIWGGAMALFQESLAEPIARVAIDQGWDALVAFGEFWGPNTVGGRHDPSDTKRVTLFDVAPHKRGLVGPQRFLEYFGDLEIAAYLGEHDWDDALVARVRRGDLPGVSFEGVVGKAGDGHRLVMAKAKTQAWVDRVLRRLGPEDGARVVNS